MKLLKRITTLRFTKNEKGNIQLSFLILVILNKIPSLIKEKDAELTITNIN